MSAAKMVADSTQSDLPEKSTRKRKKEVEKKKEKKKKLATKKGKKKQQPAEDEYDENDLDLDNEILPISSYVKNRRLLVEQLFHCVRGTSLQRVLPDVLKELPAEELKQRCLNQLEVMSKKRIRRIIAGDDPANISSSDEDEESTDEEEEEEEVEEQVEEEYMEEDGEEEEEEEEVQMADSTSQPAAEMEESDRDEEGSEDSQSPTPDREQQPTQSSKGESSLTKQKFELHRKLEEEQRLYKQRLEAYKALHAKKAEEHSTQIQEGMSGDISSQNEDSNDQFAEAVDKDPQEDSEEGEVAEEKSEVIASEQVVEENNDIEMGDRADSCEKVEETYNESKKTEEITSDKTKETDVSVNVQEEDSLIKEKESDKNEVGEALADLRVIKDVGTDVANVEVLLKTENQESDKIEGTQEKLIDAETNVEVDSGDNVEKKDEASDKSQLSSESKNSESLDVRIVNIETTETETSEAIEKLEVQNVEPVVETEAGKSKIVKENEDVDKGEGNIESEGEVEEEDAGEEEEPEEEKEPQDVSKSLTQNQMELLELEMRARAIKAMLKMAK